MANRFSSADEDTQDTIGFATKAETASWQIGRLQYLKKHDKEDQCRQQLTDVSHRTP